MNEKYYDKIAVVGLGALFPGAHNVNDFWNNIIPKKVSIKKLPEELFESEIYYRPELKTAFSKQNKSYTNIAGFIEDINYNTVRKFKIPPSVAEHMDPNQHAALYTADQALNEISLENINNERISVVYANGSVGTRYGDAIVGVQFDKIKHYLKKHPFFKDYNEKDQEELFEYLRKNAVDESIPITEDSAPGILPNIIAARVSNVFDFNGPSYTIDSACASALTSIIAGIKSLRLNESDAVVCGGSDMPIKSLGLIFFSAINALSPDGSFPFDERANGFVMGQGSGTIILKRLEDAVRNNDKIYAVINGYGEASDGKGKYIAAPNSDWQAHSIEKACLMAGYPVDTIELIEAHGTGTTVGDVVEIDGLKKAFSKLGYSKTNYCGVGSVKSNIGHLKSAAGIAGIMKTILALHNKKLPPTASLKTINPKLGLENSPFYILDQLKDWEANPNHPRRANVSAFGFGGADYHLALEEFRESDYSNNNFVISSVKDKAVDTSRPKNNKIETKENDHVVLHFSRETKEELFRSLDNFLSKIKSQDSLTKKEFINLHNLNADHLKEFRLSLALDRLEKLEGAIAFFKDKMETMAPELMQSKGIYYKAAKPLSKDEIAILFPGQASQYVNMLRDVWENSDIFKNYFDRSDAFWLSERSHTISSLIYGKNGGEEELLEKLKETENTHPAIFASSYALYKYLSDNGLNAKYMIGHSLGEITALAAAGKIKFNNALKLISARGYSFVEAKLDDKGKMISIGKGYEQCQQLIDKNKIDNISIANINSNKQTIVAGSSNAINDFKLYLDQEGVSSKILFVSHAFHTPLMKSVSKLFKDRVKDIRFHESDTNVMMNHTGKFYPNNINDSFSLTNTLAEQILAPVNFVQSINKLSDQGVKLFVEVGPNSILSSLTKNILEGKEINVLSSNYKKSDDVLSLKKLSASLFAEGVGVVPININSGSDEIIKENIEKGLKSSFEKSSVTNGSISVVYSGTSIGLPGSYKSMFRDDNFKQIFEGRNFIERLTDEEKQKMVDLQITKLIKDEKGPTFKILSSLDDVIQLAGKVGKIDMIKDYHFDESELKKMTKTISIGIAAAYEALRDAHIPLVQEYSKTTSGKYLPSKLALPKYMQNETGVIFANGFPMVDPIIEEVSKHISYYYGTKTSNEIVSFYESIIGNIKDTDAKKMLTDWFALYYSRLNQNINEKSVYQFNYNFMTQISSQANNRIAQLINAKGPNFQMNAACSSTSNAITIGEDFIKSGRVKRMIIVGADDSTSNSNLPILGAGFLSTGAATSEGDLYKAAVPFDVKRNGMIMSSGAVGIILEEKEEVRKRGVVEVCELLGTHSFNTANHPAQIDSNGFSTELNRFINKIENKYSLERKDIAKNSIYLSHETYTPPRGGCSQTEASALSHTFNSNAKDIIIGNSKGMTGHAMGAALEEAIAAKSLQYGKVPPVVNLSHKDPLLADLSISEGGSHDREYALRMSAGFGAQGHFLLLKKSANGNDRINDKNKYQNWLNEISNSSNAKTKLNGRIFIVESNEKEKIVTEDIGDVNYIDIDVLTQTKNVKEEEKKQIINQDEILNLLSSLTSYPPEMLENDMEFLADLGIETSRQSQISSSLQEKFDLNKDPIIISDSTTVGDIIKHILTEDTASSTDISSISGKTNVKILTGQVEEIKKEVIEVFSEVTKYPEDMLELDMEMEADLGIDTVKQATILSMLGEKYHMERDDNLILSDYPTIGHILDLVYQTTDVKVEETAEVEQNLKDTNSTVQQNNETDSTDLKDDVIRVFSEVTKYPEDMLELNMEMEADLGIDTVKQATILSILGEKYRLDQNEDFRLSDYPTIGSIIELVKTKGAASNNEELIDENEKVNPNNSDNLDKQEQINDLPDDTELSRQVPILKKLNNSEKNYDLKNKNVLIIGNVNETNMKICNSLTGRTNNLYSYLFPQINNPDELLSDFKKLKLSSNIDVIIDSTFIGDNEKSDENIENYLFGKVKNRFLLFKYMNEQNIIPEKVLCLISLDGAHGYKSNTENQIDPAFGAISGFYKSLRKEFEDTEVKIIDFVPNLIDEDFNSITTSTINELEHSGNGVEISFIDSQRNVLIIKDSENKSKEKINYTDEDVFLITGGGGGITFQITKALAEKYNSKFIIIGRTEIPENIEELNKLDENGLEELRNNIRLALNDEYEKVTPKMVNTKFDKITKAIEVYKNIAQLDKNRVKYISCDIKNMTSLEETIKSITNSFGTITVLIHGAGIDRSRFIDQKTFEEFNHVFNTKVKGAINLEKLLGQNSLKSVVALSSISGRFGNAAQSDYSAANAYLNSWIIKLKSNKKLNAFSFLTSGWKDYGMAWRNDFVRTGSEEMGLNLIEPNLAVKSFIEEFESLNDDSEIIIHKGLTGFIEDGLSESLIEQYPLLDRVITKNGKISKAYRMFSTKRDALIDQHRLGDIPILPAVAYSELGAEFLSLKEGRPAHFLFKEISFENPFKLFKQQARELYLEGHKSQADNQWELEIKSKFRVKQSNITNTVLHSKVNITTQLGNYEDMHPSKWKFENEKPVTLPASESLLLIEGEGPKQRIILGPLYNDIVRNTKNKDAVTIFQNSVIYPTRFPQEQLTNNKYPLQKLLVNPCFLDTLYQSCAAHLLVTRKRVYLPWLATDLGIVNVPKKDGIYTCHAQLLKESENIVKYKVTMLDENKTIRYFVRSIEFRKINL